MKIELYLKTMIVNFEAVMVFLHEYNNLGYLKSYLCGS